MSCNPCLCWNLKDGCVTVGIWSLVLSLGHLGLFGWQTNTLNSCRSMLIAGPNQQCQEYCPCTDSYQGTVQNVVEGTIFCIAQMGIFGWQIAAIKYYKDRAANNLLPVYGSYNVYDNRFPGYYERYYESPEERFYTALFVVQILALIAAFFLLFASVALIYGIHTNSRHLVWPWFPCIVAVMLCSVAYCVIWWTGQIRNYWLVLTIIEILSVLINLYCLLCVVIQYRRIVRGVAEPDYYYRQYQPKDQIIYSSGPTGETRTKIVPTHEDFYYPEPEEKKVQQGQWNPAYADTDPYGNVQLYTHPAPVHDLPPKVPLVDTVGHEAIGPPPEKTEFTEQWLDHLAESNPEIPRNLSEPASPTKLEVEPGLRPAKSVPSVRSDAIKPEKDRRHRRHRSSSVGSRSRRSRKSSRSSSSGESGDSDDDRSRKHRHRHHRSHSKDKYSDSDTGYSRSERRHHRHRHHRSKDRDRDREQEKSKRSKRPRDVKREDKERLEAKNEPPAVPPRPGSTGTDLNSWPPKYSPAPPYNAPGNAAITIPQHIVIPPTTGKGQPGKPQRFHINSEITISYSDKSTNPSDNEATRKGVWGPRITPVSGPTVTSPTDAEDGEPQTDHRASYGAESTDSKGHGSTAV